MDDARAQITVETRKMCDYSWCNVGDISFTQVEDMKALLKVKSATLLVLQLQSGAHDDESYTITPLASKTNKYTLRYNGV